MLLLSLNWLKQSDPTILGEGEYLETSFTFSPVQLSEVSCVQIQSFLDSQAAWFDLAFRIIPFVSNAR